MDNQDVNQIQKDLTGRIEGLAGVVAEATLQGYLKANMPEWITATEDAPVDAAILPLRFAQQYVPEDSFRIMKLMGNQAISNRNVALTCAIETQELGLDTDGPPGSSMLASFDGLRDNQPAELMLVTFPNCMDRIAVIPARYIAEKGQNLTFKVSEGEVPNEASHLPESVNIAVEIFPFIVSLHHLPGFLRSIRDAAEAQDGRQIINPTTRVIYHDFNPRLHTIESLTRPQNPIQARLQWLHDAFEAHGSKLKVRQNLYQPWLGDFSLETQDIFIPASVLKPHLPASVHESIPKQQPHLFHVVHSTNSWDYSSDGQSLVFHCQAQDVNFPLFKEEIAWDFFIAYNRVNQDVLVLPRDLVPQNWYHTKITGPNVILEIAPSVRRLIHSSADIGSFVKWTESHVLENSHSLMKLPLDLVTPVRGVGSEKNRDAQLSQEWRNLPRNITVQELMPRDAYFFAVNIFETAVRQLCRASKYGIFYRLGQSHPWGDFMFLPYKWDDNDCVNHDKNIKRLPRNRDAVRPGCDMVLITVCALDHHLMEPKIKDCTDNDLHQIKKAQTGQSILFSLAPGGGQLTKKSWFVIPPSKLRAASLVDKVNRSSSAATGKKKGSTSYGPVEIGYNDQDRSLARYMMPPALFVDKLRHLSRHGSVTLSDGLADTAVTWDEVVKPKSEIDQAGLQAFRQTKEM